MPLIIELDERLEAIVRAKAEQANQTPEDYVHTVLDLTLDPVEPSPFCGTPMMEKKLDSFKEWWATKQQEKDQPK